MDHAATTPMRPGVWDAMEPFAELNFGNSSGIHSVSRMAKNALEEARERVADAIGARPMEIVFTSGGTEADNLAIKGAVFNRTDRNGVVTSATEHEAVLETADFVRRMGYPTDVLGVDTEGRVDRDRLTDALSGETALVSLMMTNNETGTVQDLSSIFGLVKEADPGIITHTDAVQAFGSESIDVNDFPVDLMSVTAHKFGGPKGAGFLYVREGTPLEALLHGGGQELGRRSGTHDVAGAVGLAIAVELAVKDREFFCETMSHHRDEVAGRLRGRIPDVVFNTPQTGRSPHHLNVRIPGVRNETLLMRMDNVGISASAGSACQSGAAKVSHVLEAMGLSPEEARESIRLSFGWSSKLEDDQNAVDAIAGIVEDLR